MYHVAVNGVQQGPLNEAELRERIARGELKAADLCWQPGWPEWRKLGDALPDAFAAPAVAAPPPLPGQPVPPAAPVPAGKPKTSGLAIASLVCGICTFLCFPLFFIPAIICGHLAHSKIKRSQGALAGGGQALAGLIMGYVGVVMIPIFGLIAAMAIPAFQKVRQNSQQVTMRNDARQIASAAQQYFLEHNVESVPFEYDSATGDVSGPLSTYVKHIGKGYSETPAQLTTTDDFQLENPALGPPRTYSPEGEQR
jgi:type IV pilus assembly protein PilA